MITFKYNNLNEYVSWCKENAGDGKWRGSWHHTQDSCMDWSETEYVIEFDEPEVEVMFKLKFGF